MALDGTYAGLKASVANFLNRADLTAAITDFIALAEPQIVRRLVKDGPVRQMLARADPDIAISSEFTTLPSDFMGVRALYLSGTTCGPLEFAEPEKIVERKMLYPTMDGDPRVYSVVGTELQLWPWNGGSYAGELTYWQRFASLSNTTTTNWLLSEHPDIYLYGALLQAAPYLRDDARLNVWGAIAETAISDLIAADKIARFAPQLALTPLSHGAP